MAPLVRRASLPKLKCSLDEMTRIDSDIFNLTQQLQHLIAFRKHIENNPNSFDSEDLAAIGNVTERLEHNIRMLHCESLRLCERGDGLSQTYQMLSRALVARDKLLADNSHCLKAHPDLLVYFNRRQRRLKDLLAEEAFYPQEQRFEAGSNFLSTHISHGNENQGCES